MFCFRPYIQEKMVHKTIESPTFNLFYCFFGTELHSTYLLWVIFNLLLEQNNKTNVSLERGANHGES